MDTTRGATDAPEGPAEDEVRLDDLGDFIAFRLRMAQNVSFRAYKRLTGDAHLRPGWYAVLTLTRNNPGITPMALARTSGRDKSTITPILRDLLREGLARRQDDPNDRRSYGLHITAKGEQRLAHLAACARQHERDLAAIVGDRKHELMRILCEIAARLD